MGSKLWLMFVLVALVAVAATAESFDGSNWSRINNLGHVEDDNEILMPDEVSRRQLAGSKSRFISYGALSANSVPCSRRGASYYNCQAGGSANPYRRGCSAITNCQRQTW